MIVATPESIGTAVCTCGHTVYVRENAGGFAYYRCERCGVEYRHHIKRESAAWVAAKVTRHTPEKPEEDRKVEPSKPPEKPAKSGLRTLLGVHDGR